MFIIYTFSYLNKCNALLRWEQKDFENLIFMLLKKYKACWTEKFSFDIPFFF